VLDGGEREGAEWVVREGVGAGEEMTQALYEHVNNKIKKSLSFTIEDQKRKKRTSVCCSVSQNFFYLTQRNIFHIMTQNTHGYIHKFVK
jgi:hypothetical protein